MQHCINRTHIEAVHISSLADWPAYKCQLCTFIKYKTIDLENHSIQVTKPASLDCECSPFYAKLHINQKKHVATNHTKHLPVTYAHLTLYLNVT